MKKNVLPLLSVLALGTSFVLAESDLSQKANSLNGVFAPTPKSSLTFTAKFLFPTF